MILPSAAMVNQIEAITSIVRSSLNILGIDFTCNRESLIGLAWNFTANSCREVKSLRSETEFLAWLRCIGFIGRVSAFLSRFLIKLGAD